MRTIVCGSRSYGKQRKGEELDVYIKRINKNRSLVTQTLDRWSDITAVLSGLAKGPDRWSKKWGESNGIPVLNYPALWQVYGLGAGPIRNAQMVAEADRVIAFHDGFSTGTADCIARAREAGLEVVEFTGILEA